MVLFLNSYLGNIDDIKTAVHTIISRDNYDCTIYLII